MKTKLMSDVAPPASRFACRIAACAATSCTVLAMASPAFAAGTVAGTDIINTATATYDDNGTPITIQSNPVTIKVDELLDTTVVSRDPGDVITTNGATNVVSSFKVTNTGNGHEAYRLTPTMTNGGDQFDPALSQLVLDTNNNGVYDAGVDTVYTSGINDPNLAPDESVNVFVLSNMPGSQNNGDRAEVVLAAAANTGTGPAGTTFANQGEGGGNAVVGTTTATANASGFVVIHTATVSLAKSAIVADPFGGNKQVPGSIITYTLIATVSGSGTLNNVVVNDPIPASTQYVASSMTLQTVTLTDAADADAGNFNGTRISVGLGNVPAGQTRTVTFKAKIQ